MTKWKTLRHNMILDGGDFYISFNPCPWAGTKMFESDTDRGETALCKDGKFLILNGDFRKEYEGVFGEGYTACFAVYEQHRAEFDSSWTTQES